MRRRVPRQGQGPGLRLTRAEPEVRADDIHTRLSIFERARLVRMCAGPHGVYYIIATRLVRRKICVEVFWTMSRLLELELSPLLTCSLDIAERLNCTHSISTLFVESQSRSRGLCARATLRSLPSRAGCCRLRLGLRCPALFQSNQEFIFMKRWYDRQVSFQPLDKS